MKCIELNYITKSEKDSNGVGNDTVTTLRLPAEFLQTDEITDQDVLGELLSAIDDDTHIWHDIAMSLVESTPTSHNLVLFPIGGISTISDEIKEDPYVTKQLEFQNKGYQTHALDTNDLANALGKSQVDSAIKLLLKSQNPKILFLDKPIAVDGNPTETSNFNETANGTYDRVNNIITLSADALTSFEDIANNNLERLSLNKNMKDVLFHELIHANYHEAISNIPVSKSVIDGLAYDIPTGNTYDIIKNISKLSINEAKQELFTYLLNKPSFRNDVLKAKPELKELLLEALLGSIDPKLYNLALNLVSKNQKNYNVTPDAVDGLEKIKKSESDKVEDAEVESDKDGVDDSDTDFNTDDNGQFLLLNLTTNDLARQYIEKKFIKNYDHAKTVAPSIYANFKASVTKDSATKYRLNYGDEIPVVSFKERMHLHNLQQNDIIRIVSNELDEATGKYTPNKEGKTHYLPVISVDYFNNELKIIVATAKGNAAPIDPEDIVSFRKHKGIYDANKDSNKNQKNLAELYAVAGGAKGSKKTYRYGSDVLSTESEPLYNWVDKNNTKVPILRKEHYLNIAFGKAAKKEDRLNPENTDYKNEEDSKYDSFYFDQVIPGDFIKSSFTNKEGKKVTFVAPIVQVHGDLIEVLKSPNIQDDAQDVDLSKHKFETFYVTKESVDAIYMNKKAHNDFLDNMNSKLAEATVNGFNKAEGLEKIKFKNYTTKNEHIVGEKANWNDLTIGYAELPDGSFDEVAISKYHKSYSEWRKNLGDNIKEMRLKDLTSPIDIKYFKRHKAIERRREEFSRIGPGTFIQLETLYSEEGVAQQEATESTTKKSRRKSGDKTWVTNEVKKAARDYKTVAGWVISKSGDTLKVNIKVPTWKNGKVVGAKFKEVNVNILNAYPKTTASEKESTAYAVRSLYKDNSESLRYINFYSGLLETISRNRKDQNAMFKNGFDKGASFENFSYVLNNKNKNENIKELNDVLDGDVSWNTITGLDELYDLRTYTDDVTPDQKMKDFRRLKQGSIILTYRTKDGKKLKNDDGTYKYYSNVVVGKDSNGYPLIGYVFKGEYEYTTDGENKNKYSKDQTVVRPVSFSEVVGVGYANKTVKTDVNVTSYLDNILSKTNKNRPVYKADNAVERTVLFEADDYIKRQRKFDVNNYLSSKRITTYDSKTDPKLVQLVNNLKSKNVDVKIATMYVDSKGSHSMTKKNDSDTVLYWAAYPKVGKQKYDQPVESPYTKLFGKNLENASTLAIVSNLREGDVIVRTYKDKKGNSRDIEMIVSEIKGNKIYGYTLYLAKGSRKQYDADGNDISDYLSRSTDIDIKANEGEKTKTLDSRKGLLNVKEIQLGRKGKNYSKDRVKEVREGSINWKQKTVIDNIPAKGKVLKTAEERKEAHKQNYAAKVSVLNRRGSGAKRKSETQQPSKDTIKNQVESANNKTSRYGDAPFSKNTSEGFIKSTDRPTAKNMKEFAKRLTDMYNIPVELVNSETILREFGNSKTQRHRQRAFIANDTIYINTDYATLAEPVHELGHLILNGLKITDPKTYSSIMQLMNTHPDKGVLQDYYSELNDEQMNEELFVTLLGERFNVTSKDDVDSEANNHWKNENKSFFIRIANKIKQFFAKLFNIDSNRYFSTEPVNFMNLSINEILDNFNNKLLDGNYKNEVKTGIERAKFEDTGSFLLNKYGNTSEFFKSLTSNDLDMDFAINSWINLKSGIFTKWDDGTVMKDEYDEPKVLFRNSNDILQEEDTEGLGDAVVVKGDINAVDGGYTTDEANILSIYALNVDESVKEFVPLTTQSFTENKGLALIGTTAELNKSMRELKNQFPNKSFTMYNLNGDIFYIKEYDKPSTPILKLRELLFNKNIIQAIC